MYRTFSFFKKTFPTMGNTVEKHKLENETSQGSRKMACMSSSKSHLFGP